MTPAPNASGASPVPDLSALVDQVPVLNLDREKLFAPSIARQHGLDPDAMSLLEIPNGSNSLYNAILLYAAHYAVDLDVSLPFTDPENNHTASDHVPSANSDSKPIVNDPASPPDIKLASCNHSTSSTSTLPTPNNTINTNSSNSPSPSTNNVKTKPNTSPRSTELAIKSTTTAKLATGKSADGDPSSLKPSSPTVQASSNGFPITRGRNSVPVPTREGPGRLSSLWNCPDDSSGPPNFSDSDTDDSDDSDDSDEEEEPAPITDDSQSNILDEFASLGALKRKAEPPVQRFQMGIGYAKMLVGDEIVYVHHCAYGLPVSESYVYSIQVFRTVVLVGRNAHSLKELCAVAMKWRSDREQANQRARPGRFTLFRFKTSGNGSGEWCNQGYKRSRPPKSVILPDGQLEAIVRDIKDFVGKDTKQWYEAHGLPHRRSYLFHGPPGCGKTSTIKMIAGMFRLNACFLSLTASDFSNQVLQDALSSMPRRGLLVLEDVDVLFNEDRKSEASQSLTFSGMLNALDGLISVDGIITIFTTNHIEKLDAALIRAGRVDRRFEFDHPSAKQMAALFKSFYEDATQGLCEKFADMVLNRPEEEARSIATLQQHFIFTRKMSAEDSVANIPKFFAEFYPKGGKARNPLYI